MFVPKDIEQTLHHMSVSARSVKNCAIRRARYQMCTHMPAHVLKFKGRASLFLRFSYFLIPPFPFPFMPIEYYSVSY